MKLITALKRYFHQTHDPNFIGFKKRRKGTYQWKFFIPEKFVLGTALWDFVASQIRPTDVVMDIGCGDGAYACTLASRCQEIVGIDADWDAIHFANIGKKKYHVKNAVFRQIPISRICERFSGRVGQFNVIYAMDVIEHLPDPMELLKTMAVMLAPDGVALIGTPLFVKPELVSRYRVKEYTRGEIHDLISSCLDVQGETTVPLRREDSVLYEQGFYIGIAKRKPAFEASPFSEKREPRLAKNLWQKAAACVKERRMPYIYHRSKDFVRSCFRFRGVRIMLRRRVIPCQTEYLISRALYCCFFSRRRRSSFFYDLVFVFKKKSSGWILEGICREIARYYPGKTAIHYADSRQPWPRAKNYFFSHYSFLPQCLKFHPTVWGGRVLVFYTHPKTTDWFNTANQLYSLNQCHKVICMNSESAQSLECQGVKPEKLAVVLGGADPEVFRPHERNGGKVGFSTAYYPRKSPDLLLEIVKSMPHRRFILLGPSASDEKSGHRKWHRYKRFNELLALKNFDYLEAPYSEYARHYADVDVFVSASKLEGGPIPLIETMMCNSVPVVSKTGFAPDIVQHGKNGFLFDAKSSAAEVAALIEMAYEFKADIRKTVERLSWENYSRQIQRLLAP